MVPEAPAFEGVISLVFHRGLIKYAKNVVAEQDNNSFALCEACRQSERVCDPSRFFLNTIGELAEVASTHDVS